MKTEEDIRQQLVNLREQLKHSFLTRSELETAIRVLEWVLDSNGELEK